MEPDEGYREARSYAFRCLAARALLSSQLAEKMRRKGFEEQQIAPVVKELQEAGYLDDRNWLEHYVDKQLQGRDGPRKIAAKLALKGVSKEEVRTLLAPRCDREQQREAIKELLATRYRSRDLANARERKNLMAALFRKGFDAALIQEFFRSY